MENRKTSDVTTSERISAAPESDGLPDLTDPSSWLSSGVPVKADIRSLLELLSKDGADLNLDGPNGGYLRSLFFWCDSESFEEAMAIFKQTTATPEGRTLYLDQLYARAFSCDPPLTVRGAIQVTRQTFGSGSIARNAFWSLFAHAPITNDTFVSVRDLPYDDEKKAALAGLSRALSGKEDLSELNALHFTELSDEENQAVMRALADWTITSSYIGRSNQEAVETCLGSVLPEAEIPKYLGAIAERDPDLAWTLLTSDSPPISGDDLSSLERDCISSLAAKKGPAALDLVREMHSTQSPALFKSAMDSSLRADSIGSADWYERNQAKLPSGSKDALVSSIVEFNLAQGAEEEALEWISRVEDADLRARLESEAAPK
ncbi:hypothetical protein Hsar01_02724 [Haloferula sargassicola]|uniref:Uncharacterized protein n=1 Tax=Haloferula sargassicola TaxID=490096 RepID=A0ABP9UPK8_9BACT